VHQEIRARLFFRRYVGQLLEDSIRNFSDCDEMRWSCGRYRGEDICIQELGGKTWRKLSFIDPIVETSIMFENGSYRNMMGGCVLHWSVSG
jgi:hypothetical protein